jgi:hypothetical protein
LASARRSSSVFVVGIVFAVLFIFIGPPLIPDRRKVSLLFATFEITTVEYKVVVLGLLGPWRWGRYVVPKRL